ncbi:MAG: butyryl-CoA dehydrogenase [Thermosediminibacterales bacterium]|nr:butyryl-CoA dehydrogenase [Thermosediminibacterales bacterium]
MNFELTEEQKMIRKMVREFTEKEVAPRDEEMDRTGEFPYDIMKKMAENGLFGIPYPEEYGGAGADSVCGVITIEELAKGSASVALTLDAHWLAVDAINLFGNEEQKKKYLTPALTGEKIAAFSLTEPVAGSDAAAIQATAELDGDEWVLNGTKAFVTNGDAADIYVIAVKTDKSKGVKGISTFIVEKGSPGFSIGKKEDKMGCRGSITTELILKDCRVPKENLLGKEGEGFKIAMVALDGGRMHVGAMAVGLAEAAKDIAVKYAKERYAFGQPIGNFQAVQFMIADMEMEIEATRLMVYKTATLRDKKIRYSKEAAMVKVFGSEMAMKTAKNAIQILGGYGYTRDYAPERLLRDAKLLEIGEGASEVLRMVIGSTVLRSK